jgi:glycosyltransferase involved in cell wall biosynthesis
LADEFYLKPEEVCFAGFVPDEDLFALYRESDVFLSLSEHEGFGLPFVESLIFDLPILAYDCTAVPYTLGDAGILLKHKRPAHVAELIRRVVSDQPFRDRILAGQRRRLEEYRGRDSRGFLLEKIAGRGTPG